jgi:hypothetical protein
MNNLLKIFRWKNKEKKSYKIFVIGKWRCEYRRMTRPPMSRRVVLDVGSGRMAFTARLRFRWILIAYNNGLY